MIEIIVNGETRQVEDALSISDFLKHKAIHERTVVVEHNGFIVARDRYRETPLSAGDKLEIVQMMAGG